MKSSNFDMIDNLPVTNRLMVEACLLTGKEKRETIVREWEEKVVMDDMDFSCMRLAPLFLTKNQQDGITTKHDTRLKIIYKHWWLKTQHILDQLKKIYSAFANAGIEAVVIKGAAIMSYYERPELRPMADFDLLIKPADVNTALKILHQGGYIPDKIREAIFNKNPSLVADFKHSILCEHTLTGTKIDLHWRIGSLCSSRFTSDLWQNLAPYNAIPNGKKPQAAYELFLIIIHAIQSSGWDNLNWIIDVNLLHVKPVIWEEARRLAVAEKKEDLFDYGCSVLLKNGVNAPQPVKAIKPSVRTYYSRETRTKMSFAKTSGVRLREFYFYLKYLFPYSGAAGKFYHGIRLIRLFITFKISVMQLNKMQSQGE